MRFSPKLIADNFSPKYGQKFTYELEICFANCNLGHQEKLQLIDFIERAYECGKNSNNNPLADMNH
jgi:hypothetical protein